MTTCRICSKPFSDHEAGRELDACVAIAKGWTEVRRTPVATSKRISKTVTIWTGIPPASKSWEPIPYYSTKIEDAMTLWQDGWSLECTDRFENPNTWLINRYIGCNNFKIVVTAKTPALAITLAYLTEGSK